MRWLYHHNYIGPDRRGARFEIRFFERRTREAKAGTRASVEGVLRDLFARGLKWVDETGYFGPDRRSGAFSHFFLERRHHQASGSAPPLHAALRQLRVRVLEADTQAGRAALQERLTATALLADAQGRRAIGDLLVELAGKLDTQGSDLSATLQSELLAAEALMNEPAAPRA